MIQSIFKKDVFFNWVTKELTDRTGSSYVSSIKCFVNTRSRFEVEMEQMESLYRQKQMGQIEVIVNRWLDEVDNIAEWSDRHKGDVKSALKKYLEFLLCELDGKAKSYSMPCLEKPEKVSKPDYLQTPTTGHEVVYTEDEIRKNFAFRIITQDRFGSYGVAFPISMIKSLCNRKGDGYKQKIEAFVNQTVDSIVMYSFAEHYPFSSLSKLQILASGESVVHLKNGYSFVLYGKSSENELRPLVTDSSIKDPISKISIEHETAMKNILISYKEQLPTLVSFSHLQDKSEASDSMKRGEFDTIDMDKLLEELCFVMSKTQLALMDKHENSKKSCK